MTKETLFPNNDNKMEYPSEVKVCENTDPLFCNSFIKVRNFRNVLPYNFFMGEEDWESVQNLTEAKLALRFGMEFDLNQLNPATILTNSFNTMMYCRFQAYVRKNALREAAKLVAEFESTAFTVRTRTTFMFLQDETALQRLGSSALANKLLDRSNIKDTMVEMAKLQQNGGPLFINRNMYTKVFSRDYDSKALQLMSEQGIYRGEGNKYLFDEFDRKFK